MSEFVVENQSEYNILKAEITSDRTEIGIDIKNVITDLTIYEHIEKPYLTAKIVFSGFIVACIFALSPTNISVSVNATQLGVVLEPS